MDLMPCQMCGGKAEQFDSSYNMIEVRVECFGCAMVGPVAYFDDCEKNDTSQAIEQSARDWNRMQSLIARGLLLEDGAAAKKGGRL